MEDLVLANPLGLIIIHSDRRCSGGFRLRPRTRIKAIEATNEGVILLCL